MKPRKARRLTQLEWRVLLHAAIAFENDQDNFDHDDGVSHHEAIQRAIGKMERAEKWPGK